MNYKVGETSTLTADLLAQWKKLWQQSPHGTLFNSPDWYAYAQSVHQTIQTTFFVCTKDDTLVAIMPLARSMCFGVPVLSPLCAYYAVDKTYLLASYDKDLVCAFFGAMFSHGNIYIPKMDEELARILSPHFPQAFFSLMSVNPFIDLREEPLRFLSTNDSKELRRLLRKYSGHVKLHTVRGKELSHAVEDMFSIDQRSGKQKHRMDIFSDDEARNAFRSFATHLAPYIEVAMLHYDDKPVGYVFSFHYKDVFLPYQASYLFEYRKLSPGKMIMYQLLDSLRNTSYTRFDFSGGISSYKREFTKQFYIQYNMYWTNNPLINLWWKGINTARRAKQILLPLRNTNDHLYLFKPLSHEKEIL